MASSQTRNDGLLDFAKRRYRCEGAKEEALAVEFCQNRQPLGGRARTLPSYPAGQLRTPPKTGRAVLTPPTGLGRQDSSSHIIAGLSPP